MLALRRTAQDVREYFVIVREVWKRPTCYHSLRKAHAPRRAKQKEGKTYITWLPCIYQEWFAQAMSHPTRGQEPNPLRGRACIGKPCLTSQSANYVRQVTIPTDAYSSPSLYRL
jgi:hypothetical protein